MPTDTVKKIEARVSDLERFVAEESDDEQKTILEVRLSEAKYLLSLAKGES